MGNTFISLLVFLFAAQVALCQDCLTDEGRVEFLQTVGPECSGPLLLLLNDEDILASQLAAVCTEDCVGEAVEFLQSTEECRNDEQNKADVSFLEDQLCGFKDGIDNPQSSCIFQDFDGLDPILDACFAWWYPGDNDTCPHENCTIALAAAEDAYGCCYNAIYGNEYFIKNITEIIKEILIATGTPPDSIPDDFEVDITDGELWEACSLTRPDSCPNIVEGDFATIPVATPLVVMLFALLSKIIA